jgi:threonine dehydratase
MADISTTLPLCRESVLAAHALIKPHIHRTPVLTNTTLSSLASTARSPEDLKGTRFEGRTPAKPKIRLWFKCENLQRIGAFKVRGAFHALQRLMMEEGWVEGGGKERGVVTHSSGESSHSFSSSSPCPEAM